MLAPDFDGARLVLAQQQSQAGHAERARAMLAEIAPGSPYAGSARTMEAWMLLDAGETDRALLLARANAESGDARAKRALADMYRTLERYSEAEPIYSELIVAQGDDWRLYFARGAARERLGRWPDAESDLRRALELSPEQPDVMNYLGYSWVDRGERLQEGLALIQRAVELRPGSGAIIDSLGWAHYRLGDYAQALDLLERAVELEPADPTLNDHLGDVYWRLGRRIEARFQWQRALTLDPDNPDAIRGKLEHGLQPEPDVQSVNR
jgi:Flp pilus assembly protein TadD